MWTARGTSTTVYFALLATRAQTNGKTLSDACTRESEDTNLQAAMLEADRVMWAVKESLHVRDLAGFIVN